MLPQEDEASFWSRLKAGRPALEPAVASCQQTAQEAPASTHRWPPRLPDVNGGGVASVQHREAVGYRSDGPDRQTAASRSRSTDRRSTFLSDANGISAKEAHENERKTLRPIFDVDGGDDQLPKCDDEPHRCVAHDAPLPPSPGFQRVLILPPSWSRQARRHDERAMLDDLLQPEHDRKVERRRRRREPPKEDRTRAAHDPSVDGSISSWRQSRGRATSSSDSSGRGRSRSSHSSATSSCSDSNASVECDDDDDSGTQGAVRRKINAAVAKGRRDAQRDRHRLHGPSRHSSSHVDEDGDVDLDIPTVGIWLRHRATQNSLLANPSSTAAAIDGDWVNPDLALAGWHRTHKLGAEVQCAANAQLHAFHHDHCFGQPPLRAALSEAFQDIEQQQSAGFHPSPTPMVIPSQPARVQRRRR